MSEQGWERAVRFGVDLRAHGVPEPVREHMFAKEIGRRWRFDLCWPDRKLAVEIDGGTWAHKPSHSGGAGHRRDCEKRNAAIMLGWRVLTYSTDMLANAAEQIAEAWKAQEWRAHDHGNLRHEHFTSGEHDHR